MSRSDHCRSTLVFQVMVRPSAETVERVVPTLAPGFFISASNEPSPSRRKLSESASRLPVMGNQVPSI